jgi:hypothetical protein
VLPEDDVVSDHTTRPATGDSGERDPTRRSTGRRGARLAAAVAVALGVLLVAFGVVAAVGSFASYTSVKDHLDSFASDGDADLTRSEFDAIVLRLRAVTVFLVVSGVGILLSRHRLAGGLATFASDVAVAWSSLRRAVATAIARESRLHLAALGAVTLVAAVVRLEFLFQPMRYDESVTYVHYASQPWYIALTTYTAPNNHVLHSLAVHASTGLFGGEPWAIRLPALIAGILLVPSAYVLGRVLYGKHAGLVGTGLVAGSSVIVEYSTNARGYTMVALVFVLMLALATRLATSWNLGEWLTLSVLAAIGIFTVPVMVYGLGAVAVWLVLSFPAAERRALATRRLLPFVAVALALSAALYAPLVATSGIGSLVGNQFVEALPWGTFADRLPDALSATWQGWTRDVPLVLEAVLLAGFGIALVAHSRVSRFRWSPAVAALMWIAPVVALQRVVPFERVWLFLLPLFLLTAAAGALFALRPLTARTAHEGRVAAVVAVALALGTSAGAVATQSVAESEDTSTLRDGDRISELIEHRLLPGDKVLVAPPADGILRYQLARRGLDAASLVEWQAPGKTARFLVVVKDTPGNYDLDHVLGDPRLAAVDTGEPRLIRRFGESSVYAVLRQS